MNSGAAHPRVIVIGSSCAGKSTFARELAAARNCPYIELDVLHWDGNWTPKPGPEFRRLVEEATAAERWVLAGNYSVVREIVWPRATTVVWLDFGFPRVLWRGLRRTVQRCATGEVIFHGNRESFGRSFFSKESILLWIVTTFHRRRREFAALRASGRFGHLAWHRVRHPREVRAVLHALRDGG